MPSWSSPRLTSGPEQSIPFDHSPRSWRRLISMPPAITAPMVAKGTRSPTDMLNAPQQTWRDSPSPASTSTNWIRSASGWGRRSRTRATTMPSSPSPIGATSSTVSPRSLNCSAIPAGSPATGANSSSQD